MTLVGQIFDWLIKAAGAVGLPAVLIYLLYYRRKVTIENRSLGARAAVDEATIPVAIKSSSVTQLEAELAALATSFETDRKIKGDTIDWLQRQLEEERAANREALRAKDDKIRELEETIASLQGKVTSLQTNVHDLNDELQKVADELAALHSDTP